MPITFFEGVREAEREDLNRRNMERRFHSLAAAVRDHEATARRAGTPVDPRDHNLYRRLRQICGEPLTDEHSAA